MTRLLTAVFAVAFAGTAPGCLGPTEPSLPDADLRVLFVGNSLTYTNDLPGLVETVAAAAGHSLEAASVAGPNMGLGDHWVTGTPETIRSLRPDVVVLQQGPSTLLSSRAYLVEWTDSMARVAHEVGAETALLMVWPPEDPRYTFQAVHDSYRAAADAVGGRFIPAGMAWVEAWDVDPSLPLYGPDRFHPGGMGSVLAALSVVRSLLDQPVNRLPLRMEPAAGRPSIELSADVAPTLFDAVERAHEEYGGGPPPHPAG
ncbi:hypothetical protein [Gaopeijia maritima]|uniref:SGNH/GDSL hydrolase family protein n=1 Tax=Gaopeijia maritima TaxID=3119007 RepID=A0ABU9E9U4_9BACT